MRNTHTRLPAAALPPQVYFYPQFSAARDGQKLAMELTHNLSRPTAWESVMRIRCSKGVRIAAFHGHFFNRSTDLLALPTCDPDKAFAVQVALEEAVMATSVAYVQCALLYTSSNGERRIRVHTMSVPVVSELADLYRATDGVAMATLNAMLTVERSLTSKLDDARNSLHARVRRCLVRSTSLHGAGLPAIGACWMQSAPTACRCLDPPGRHACNRWSFLCCNNAAPLCFPAPTLP